MARMHTAVLLAGLAALVAGTGCAYDSPVGDHWGEAQQHHATEMVAHPEADKLPVHDGIDGVTGEQTMNSYRRAQQQKKGQRSGSIINIDAK